MVCLEAEYMERVAVDISGDATFPHLTLGFETLREVAAVFMIPGAKIHLQRLHDMLFGDRKTLLVRAFEQQDEIVYLVQRNFLHFDRTSVRALYRNVRRLGETTRI